MRLIKLNILSNYLYNFFFSYPAPINFSYFQNFGIYSFLCLFIQILTGIFLAMHYVADQQLAFLSVEHIMRDVSFGQLLRYIHANGASMFFIVVYIHLLRGLYYFSFLKPRNIVQNLGVCIFLLMIITAFLGYVLPQGQMSFQAATVITNLLSVIPKVGNLLVIQLQGGYSVNNATLNRFFSLHYLLPFVIIAFVILHFIFLHETGSNNPLGIEFKYIDHITMYPYYILKDLYGLLLFFLFFIFIVCFFPNVLGHTDNYIFANSMVTPLHIVPEQYFLPFYTILRSIPDKLFGVIFMISSILILFCLSLYTFIEVRNLNFKLLTRILFQFFFSFCVLLGQIGGKPAIFPFVQIGQIVTIFYFSYFLFLFPLSNKIEQYFQFYMLNQKIQVNFQKYINIKKIND